MTAIPTAVDPVNAAILTVHSPEIRHAPVKQSGNLGNSPDAGPGELVLPVENAASGAPAPNLHARNAPGGKLPASTLTQNRPMYRSP